MKRTRLILLPVLAALSACGAAPSSPATTQQAPTAPPAQVNFLSMGDWGQAGKTQRIVADNLARHVNTSGLKYEAMLTAGDNFYVPLLGIDDPKWQTMFEQMYDPAVLNFPFYVALGNHDYDLLDKNNPAGPRKWQVEIEYAKANPQSRWKLPSRWYRLELPKENPLVTVLMLDSDRTLLGPELWKEELAWIAAELEKPRKTPWLIAVAHHPLFSNGDHGDVGPLQRELGPLFQQHGVDFFIAGHDHDLQHLEIDGYATSFLLVGGGGAGIRPMRNDVRGPFSRSVYGFADLQFTEERATVRYISGTDGTVLHAFTRTKAGKVNVIQTTPSDRATPRTVRSITRPDAASAATTTRAATSRATTTAISP